MKKLFLIFVVLFCFTCIRAQQEETELVSSSHNTLRNHKTLSAQTHLELEEFSAPKIVVASYDFTVRREQKKSFQTPVETYVKEKDADESEIKGKEKFHWKSAVIQSGIFLGIQHGFRLLQKKTRQEFAGPFLRDWTQSVKNLRGWRDGDQFFTNYIAHPLQGGATGRIFINNSDRAKKQEFGTSKEYWESRLKAMAWSAVWSTQFELGPISEANLGNVGLREKFGYSTTAWVDLVVTPIVGTGVVIVEDASDKYILKNWVEKKINNKIVVKILRCLFTPTTGFSNLLRGKMPWYRDTRPL